MLQISFRDIINSNSKSICNCIIKKGMTLEQALEAICTYYNPIYEAINLDGVKYGHLGITATCELTYKNLLTEVINSLIQHDIDFSNSLTQLNNSITQIIQSSSNFKDELVKVNADDTASGYLFDKITSPQVGNITLVDNRVNFMGFVPIGAVMMINKSRLVDFESNGKGKALTDVWGYAISNGANGTVNRLGKMIKFATDVTLAGTSGGADSVTLTEGHIPSMTLGVTGTISDALTNQRPNIKTNIQELPGGTGRNFFILGNLSGTTTSTGDLLTLQHTHAFSLEAKKTNPAPTPISLIPSHILEIPIERITV